MKLQHRLNKKVIALAAAGCLSCSAGLSQAQDFGVSPSAPEAYQPFTLSVPVNCALSGDSLLNVEAGSNLLTLGVAIGVDWSPCPTPPLNMASVMGLQGGTYSVKIRSLDGLDEFIAGDITITPAPPTQPVYAFYNYSIGHYFITGTTAERDLVLGGGAGDGWMIVDDGFKVWPAAGPAPAAAKPVCRFYSPSVNSHFYTAGSGECESLKLPGSGWTYEGIAFRALVPTNGSCYPGTTPVWRLYNNRFAQADSNHRFVASPDTYRHMIANGWIGEGVGFCSPP